MEFLYAHPVADEVRTRVLAELAEVERRHDVRVLLAVRWLDAGLGMPPMRFADLAAATVEDPALGAEINALLAVKMAAGEAECAARFPRIHAFIEQALAQEPIPPDFRQPTAAPAVLDRLLYETVCGTEFRRWDRERKAWA